MFLLSTALVAQIKPERVHLVDMHPRDAPKNFMFRGNSPTSKNSTTGKYQLDYDVLVSALRTAAADECNVTLPATFPAGYRIVDVDLENLFDDGYEAELKYWTAHPEQGEAIKWITLGSLLEPKHTPFRDALVANGTWAIEGNGDYLVERLAQLRSMLLWCVNATREYSVARRWLGTADQRREMLEFDGVSEPRLVGRYPDKLPVW